MNKLMAMVYMDDYAIQYEGAGYYCLPLGDDGDTLTYIKGVNWGGRKTQYFDNRVLNEGHVVLFPRKVGAIDFYTFELAARLELTAVPATLDDSWEMTFVKPRNHSKMDVALYTMFNNGVFDIRWYYPVIFPLSPEYQRVYKIFGRVLHMFRSFYWMYQRGDEFGIAIERGKS